MGAMAVRPQLVARVGPDAQKIARIRAQMKKISVGQHLEDIIMEEAKATLEEETIRKLLETDDAA